MNDFGRIAQRKTRKAKGTQKSLKDEIYIIVKYSAKPLIEPEIIEILRKKGVRTKKGGLYSNRSISGRISDLVRKDKKLKRVGIRKLGDSTFSTVTIAD